MDCFIALWMKRALRVMHPAATIVGPPIGIFTPTYTSSVSIAKKPDASTKQK
jgi:hypothetical protein